MTREISNPETHHIPLERKDEYRNELNENFYNEVKRSKGSFHIPGLRNIWKKGSLNDFKSSYEQKQNKFTVTDSILHLEMEGILCKGFRELLNKQSDYSTRARKKYVKNISGTDTESDEVKTYSQIFIHSGSIVDVGRKKKKKKKSKKKKEKEESKGNNEPRNIMQIFAPTGVSEMIGPDIKTEKGKKKSKKEKKSKKSKKEDKKSKKDKKNSEVSNVPRARNVMQIFAKPESQSKLPESLEKISEKQEPVHTYVNQTEKGDENVIVINTEVIPFPTPPEEPKSRKKVKYDKSSRQKLLEELDCYTKATKVLKADSSDSSEDSSSIAIKGGKYRCFPKTCMAEDDKSLLWKLIKLECLSTESEPLFTPVEEKKQRQIKPRSIKGTEKRFKVRTTEHSTYERTIEDKGNIFPKFNYKTTDRITSEEFLPTEDVLGIIDRKLKDRCTNERNPYETMANNTKEKKPEPINEYGLLEHQISTHAIWPMNINDQNVDKSTVYGKMKRDFIMGDRMIKRYWENAIKSGPHKKKLIENLTQGTFAEKLQEEKPVLTEGVQPNVIKVNSVYDDDGNENTIRVTNSQHKVPIELILNLDGKNAKKNYIQYKSKIHLVPQITKKERGKGKETEFNYESNVRTEVPEIRFSKNVRSSKGKNIPENNLTKTRFVKVKMPCIKAGRVLPRKSTLELVVSRSTSCLDSDSDE